MKQFHPLDAYSLTIILIVDAKPWWNSLYNVPANEYTSKTIISHVSGKLVCYIPCQNSLYSNHNTIPMTFVFNEFVIRKTLLALQLSCSTYYPVAKATTNIRETTLNFPFILINFTRNFNSADTTPDKTDFIFYEYATVYRFPERAGTFLFTRRKKLGYMFP